MPPVVDTGPDAGSNLVSGEGSNVLSFTMPSAPRYVVQSVVATVNNSAGGDTIAVLTMKDANGAVIADQTQDDVIPAGATGRTTFALGLRRPGGGGRAALETAKATWTPAEVMAGAVKTMFRAIPGTILYPADFLMAVTDDFNPTWGVSGPFLFLQSGLGTWPWPAFNLAGGGVGGQWQSWSSMVSEYAFTPWARQITGESLQAVLQPNDLISVTQGQLAAFVTARRIVWTA